jgi:hypothetical protein
MIGPEYQDDGLSSEEEDKDDIDPIAPLALEVPQLSPVVITEPPTPTVSGLAMSPMSSIAAPVALKNRSASFNLPKLFPTKKSSLTPSLSADSSHGYECHQLRHFYSNCFHF